MYELPLAWSYDPDALEARQLEQVKATKLRFKTIMELDPWMCGQPGGTSTPVLVLELLPDPRFRQQQGGTLSSVIALLPSNLNAVSFNRLAGSYPKLASLRFEPAIVGDPGESFDAEMLKDWHQLHYLDLAYFNGMDLSELPHTLHTLRVHQMDLQDEDEDDDDYLELPDGMLLQRLELNLASMGGTEMIIPGSLLTAAVEVHVLADELASQETTLILAGFASARAFYEELLASRIQGFWVDHAVSLCICPEGLGRFRDTCLLELPDLEEAAKAAMARGQGYLALTDATTSRFGTTFRLTRVPPAG